MTQSRKPLGKLYASIIAIVAVVLFTTGAVLTYAAYPTTAHRDISRQQSELLEANGGTFNFEAYDNPAFIKLTETPEAKHSANINGIQTYLGFAIYVVLVGCIYNYLRRRNVSRSRRTIGLTAVLITIGNTLSMLLLQYPNSYLSGTPLKFDSLYFVGLLGSIILTLVISFVIAAIFEYFYNKKHSFQVK